jgi:protein TonB
MHEGGFLQDRRPSPVRLGIVVALHGAVLTALIMAPAEKILRLPTSIQLIPVIDPPDPAPLPMPKAEPEPERQDRIETNIPIVSIPDVSNTKLVEPAFPKLFPTAPTPTPVDPPRPAVLTDAIPDPRYADSFQPDYPAAMARAEIEGIVTVKVLIDVTGRVKQVIAVSATDPAFFAATEKQALRFWRFKPATRDGERVESWRTMTVRFRLQG